MMAWVEAFIAAAFVTCFVVAISYLIVIFWP
jgi:hypothetical protein